MGIFPVTDLRTEHGTAPPGLLWTATAPSTPQPSITRSITRGSGILNTTSELGPDTGFLGEAGAVERYEKKPELWDKDFESYQSSINGLTAKGYQKILTNQQVLHDAVASLDSEGVASRLKASETSASQAAGAAQASAAVAGSAAEITQAAAPVLDALKQMQAQLATVQANQATMQAKLDAVEKKQGEACCSIM
jgi:hypothetical protein